MEIHTANSSRFRERLEEISKLSYLWLLMLFLLAGCVPSFVPLQPATLALGQGYFEASGGLKLFYQRTLPNIPEKSVVILLHGLGDHLTGASYTEITQHLASKGHAVYAYDARGHGYSPGARGYINDWSEFREDLGVFVRFVQAHELGKPLFLLGFSMGALTTLDYALEYPQGLAGVIAVSAPTKVSDVSEGFLVFARAAAAIAPAYNLGDLPSSGPGTDNLSRDPKAHDGYKNDTALHSITTARLGLALLETQIHLRKNATRFSAPLLMLHGTADTTAPPDDYVFNQASNPDKTRKLYDGAFHDLFLEINRQEVYSDISSWIEARVQ